LAEEMLGGGKHIGIDPYLLRLILLIHLEDGSNQCSRACYTGDTEGVDQRPVPGTSRWPAVGDIVYGL
jgi:hypothetical protein